MKEILLIGKLGQSTQNMHSLLSPYFHVQICADTPEVAKSILKMCPCDAVIINLLDMGKLHSLIFSELRNNYASLPVYVYGSDRDLAGMDNYISSIQFQVIKLPIDEREFLFQLCQRIGEDVTILSNIEDEMAFFKKKKLLFIDDDPLLLRNMNRLLKDRYDVTVASSGAEGIAAVSRDLPDMIFLDYDMPICDGKQTLQMIRSMEGTENIPVVFLTGISDKAHIQSVLSMRPAGYLLKPADTSRILNVIRKTIGESIPI